MTLRVEVCTQKNVWDAQVNAQSGHPMQLWGWGETKAHHHWNVERVLLHDDASASTTGGSTPGGDAGSDVGTGTAASSVVGSAQILYRALPYPFRSLAYLARGPQGVAGRERDVLDAVALHVKSTRGSVALSAEPDVDADSPWTAALTASGWVRSENTILIPRTLILDLSQSDDELLAAMTKKTRQYIRKSGREELEYRRVEPSEIPACLAVYKETAQRAGFGIHQDDYYVDIQRFLGEDSPIFAAFKGAEVVAFLWLASSDATAFELYGGMNSTGSELRANFSLKWLAITAMKERGVKRYDFNGLLNDGVSQFKFGFASHENMLAGTWDKPLSPLYPLYAKGLPLARKSLRKAQQGAAAVRGTLRGKLRAMVKRGS